MNDVRVNDARQNEAQQNEARQNDARLNEARPSFIGRGGSRSLSVSTATASNYTSYLRPQKAKCLPITSAQWLARVNVRVGVGAYRVVVQTIGLSRKRANAAITRLDNLLQWPRPPCFARGVTLVVSPRSVTLAVSLSQCRPRPSKRRALYAVSPSSIDAPLLLCAFECLAECRTRC